MSFCKWRINGGFHSIAHWFDAITKYRGAWHVTEATKNEISNESKFLFAKAIFNMPVTKVKHGRKNNYKTAWTLINQQKWIFQLNENCERENPFAMAYATTLGWAIIKWTYFKCCNKYFRCDAMRMCCRWNGKIPTKRAFKNWFAFEKSKRGFTRGEM